MSLWTSEGQAMLHTSPVASGRRRLVLVATASRSVVGTVGMPSTYSSSAAEHEASALSMVVVVLPATREAVAERSTSREEGCILVD